MDLSELRKEYATHGLDRHELLDCPLAQFKAWFHQAKDAGVNEPNAMVLSTIDDSGAPTSRTVLLKAADEAGFSFFTNYHSRKGGHMEREPRIALVFPWFSLERQVHISGSVVKTSEEESVAYFARRPYGSQLGALASDQSQFIPDRQHLETRLAELKAQYPEGQVPKPTNWGGYRLIPDHFEFWQGRLNRLHDRFIYVKKDGCWQISRLAP
jgi:pyridoxamine 5'-phosphate oxidase